MTTPDEPPFGSDPEASVESPVPGFGDGEAADPARRRSRWRRILAWTSISLVTVLVLVVGGVALDAWWLNSRITKQPVEVPPTASPRPSPLADATHAENFVLIGSDTRQGASGNGTGGDNVQGARADTTIILHIAADDRGAELISIPRDSYVQIPSCVIGPGDYSTPTEGKFNAAFATGAEKDVKLGGSCTVHTIESLTGVPMNHYAVIDFAGFQHMVDALGGVNVCVAEPLDDPKVHDSSGYHGTDLNLQAGPSVHIDGATALKLMRARYGLDGGGDLPRIKRQQVFIAAMIRKATSSGLLTHPLELQSFLKATTGSLTTDGFGITTMQKLASALHREGAGSIRLLTVPNYSPGPDSPLYADVIWQEPEANRVWNALRNDKPIRGLAKQAPLTVAPSSIDLKIENASGVKGEAQKAAQELQAQGFHVVSAGPAAGGTIAATAVEYGADKVESSQTVTRSIPGSVTRPNAADDTTITVILGRNYTGAVHVHIGAVSGISSETAADHSCLS